MGRFFMDRCLGVVAVFALFAGSAVADTTPPQLVNFSISPLSVDTSAGPATLNVSISAQDNNGFGANAAGNGSLSLALQSGNTVFSRQSLPITGGSSTNPVFQFAFTLPQFTPAGNYSIGMTLVDNAPNTSIFDAARLQSLGLPSIIAVTDSAFGSITLTPSSANIPASGGAGSIAITSSSSGFAWSSSSNVAWLSITSGASGTGNGTIAYFAAANITPSARAGIVTVNGQTFTATQAAAGAALNTTASGLQFAYQSGGAAPPPQTITVFSSGAPLNFTATASSLGNWLFVSPSSGVTSTALSVFVNPIGLAPGIYLGSVIVAAAGSSNGSQTEAVTLVVSAGPAVTITPGALSFSYQQGGSAVPAQSLLVSAAASAGFTASASSAGGWLAVNPASATTTSTVAVSVFPFSLAPGTYGGTVSISTTAGFQNIPVTLVVTAPSTVAVSPSSLTFAYSIGGAVPPPQALTFSGGAGSPSFTATAASAGGWLALASSTGSSGVSVSVNQSGLAIGVYTGTITVTEAGSTPQSVPVTLIVSAGQGFSVSPSALAFNVQLGTPRRTLFLTITSADTNARFTAITLSNTSGASLFSLDMSGSFAAGQLGVSVDSSSLQAGIYVGSVTITGANSSQVVPITLTVSGTPLVTAIPTSLMFSYQQGGAFPPSQSLTISANVQSAGFSAVVSTGGAWLSVLPLAGFTPGQVAVSVATTGLNVGTYSGSIVVAGPGLGGSLQSIPVTLIVAPSSAVTISPTSLAVNYQVGDPNPAPATFSLSGPPSTLTASASSTGAWLSITPAGGSVPGTVIARITPAGLAPGSYSGAIQIFPSGAAMQTIAVLLTVNTAQNLTISASSLSFAYQIGGALPASQNITVGCASSALSFRPVAASSGSWLSSGVSASQGNNQIIVSVNLAGLSLGSYSGTVTIFGVGACNSSQVVPVSLLVSGAAQQPATVSAASLAFTYQIGNGIPLAQSIAIGCAGSSPFTIATSSSGWLRVTPLTGVAPSSVSVAVDPAGLSPGAYSGSLTVSVFGGCAGTPTVSVMLLVVAAQPVTAALTFSVGSLSFNAGAGGQNVLVVCSGPASQFQASAASNGNWLTVSPVSGSTPAVLTVSVNTAGLAAGSYAGSISATSAACGSTPTLPVTLIVIAAPVPVQSPVPTVTPSSLAFNYQTGDANPSDQTLSLGATATLPFTVAAVSAGWLSVSPAGGAAPINLTISANPAGLSAGTYSGLIVIETTTGSSGASQNVAVTLTISTPAAPIVTATPIITSIVNGVSLLVTPLAPGEIVSIVGSGLGPALNTPFQLTPAGLLDLALAGTRVIVDGTPAPIISAQAGEVTAIVPSSVAGKAFVAVQLEYQGVRSAPASFLVAGASPAIFTVEGSGHGQAALLNQDASLNSSINPADRGSMVVLYATGAGLMDPLSDDGSIAADFLAQPVAAVSVFADGQNCEIAYAGAAPGLLAGILEVNFRLPPQIATGEAVGLSLRVGRLTSQPGVTLAVR